MKKLTQSLLSATLLAAALLSLAPTAHAQGDCAGCDSLRHIEDRLRKLPDGTNTDDESALATLQATSQALLALPHRAGNKLSLPQVHEMVQVLRLSEPHDNIEMVIDSISDLVVANKDAIKAELKSIPSKESTQIATGITSVIEQDKYGNDETTKPLPKK